MASAGKLIQKTKGRIMKGIDVARVASGNLRRNRMRTLLTSLGMVIAIAIIIFWLSFGFGLQELVTKQLASPAIRSTFEVTTEKAVKLDDKMLRRFKKMEGVAAVSPKSDVSAQVSKGEIVTDCAVYGVKAEYLSLENLRGIGGRNLSLKGASDVVVSRATLKTFNIKPEKAVGKFINIRVIGGSESKGKSLGKFRISGVTDEKNTRYAYVSMKKLSKLKLKEYSSAKIKVKSYETMKKVRQKVEKMGFKTSAAADTLGTVNTIFLGFLGFLFALEVMALLIAAISIFNTMTISLLERIHEVGIMKAVGITDRDVKRLFIYEAAIISLAGGSTGVLIGYVVSKIVGAIIKLIAVYFESPPIDIFYTPPWLIVATLLITLVVGLATGIYPARRAAKLNPAEALRTE